MYLSPSTMQRRIPRRMGAYLRGLGNGTDSLMTALVTDYNPMTAPIAGQQLPLTSPNPSILTPLTPLPPAGSIYQPVSMLTPEQQAYAARGIATSVNPITGAVTPVPNINPAAVSTFGPSTFNFPAGISGNWLLLAAAGVAALALLSASGGRRRR